MGEDEKKRILEMLREGKITVEEATQLLDALESKPQAENIAVKGSRGRKPKKLRVLVDSGDESKKNPKVNVGIPISLVRTVGPLILRNMPREARDELDKNGVDVAHILEDVQRMLDEGIEEDIVNIDTGKDGETAKIRIYIE